MVGMTALPEARLARECELPYALLALVTDRDAGDETNEAVSANAVLEILRKQVIDVQNIIRKALGSLPDPRLSPASTALDAAILTPPSAIGEEAKAKLGPVLQRWLEEKARRVVGEH